MNEEIKYRYECEECNYEWKETKLKFQEHGCNCPNCGDQHIFEHED